MRDLVTIALARHALTFDLTPMWPCGRERLTDRERFVDFIGRGPDGP